MEIKNIIIGCLLIISIWAILDKETVFVGCGNVTVKPPNLDKINDATYDIYNEIYSINNKINGMNFDCKCPPFPEIKVASETCFSYFETIILSNAQQKKYELDVYDCTEFADNTANELKQLGWDASSITIPLDCDTYGYYFNNCSDYHKIVKVKNVYVEATTGYIIHPDDYDAYGLEKYNTFP